MDQRPEANETAPPEWLIVFDLEATCWDDRSIGPNETIEIGAVAMRALAKQWGREPESEFQIFIRPQRRPQLSNFCRELTSISQADVDAAPAFPDALAQFVDWCTGHRPFRLAAWGDYDRNQIARDCQLHAMSNPLAAYEYINVKRRFGELRGVRPPGLGKALKMLELPHQGTAHRGIDDARNIARIVQTSLGVTL